MEQITLNEYRKIVHEELEKCGVSVPVELKFDYSCIQGAENVEKTKKFVKLCNGNWRNAIYVTKNGERYGDYQFFDLLFVVDENDAPICLPVPLARVLFSESDINPVCCHDVIKGMTYEYIYRKFYNSKDELPF